MADIEYSEEEKSALKGIFDLHDKDNSGAIPSAQLGAIRTRWLGCPTFKKSWLGCPFFSVIK